VIDLTYSLDTNAGRPWLVSAAPDQKLLLALTDDRR